MWCIDSTLQLPDLSPAEDVRYAFRTIFNDAQKKKAILALGDFFFWRGAPEDDPAQIREYWLFLC